MQNDILLLLTGTINTQNKMFTALTDKDQRKREYISTIQYYLANFDFPIVFVENSGEDISGDFTQSILDKRLEVLTFHGNDYAPELGKGTGEMNCMEHGIKNSRLLRDDHFVFKITGRYIVRNLGKYVQYYRGNQQVNLMADLTSNFRLSASGFFGFRPFFVTEYLLKKAPLLNDTEHRYFEHMLARAVLHALSDDVSFSLLKYYPRISAISGTTAKKYNDSWLHYFPRNMKYLLRYYILKR
jgi:hypothetical protein